MRPSGVTMATEQQANGNHPHLPSLFPSLHLPCHTPIGPSVLGSYARIWSSVIWWGTRPGVVCPKSWRSGCEPATLETVPSHPYHLPCRARSELALGAGDDVGAGSLTDAAIQATESLLVGLAFFDLAVVVGPAVAVGWATRVRAPCARHGPACGCHAGTTGKPCTHLRKLQTVRQRCRPPRCPGRPHPSNPRRSR